MDDDTYAEDDFEASAEDAAGIAAGAGDSAEDEVRPPADEHDEAAAASARQRSRAIQDALAIDDDALLGGDNDGEDRDGDRVGGEECGSESDGERNNSRTAKKKKQPPRVSGQHLLDNSRWTFAIQATRIRALQLPASLAHAVGYGRRHRDSAPAIRELRVFAALDKQPMQSHGSEWKREPRPETPQMNLRERAKRQAASRSSPRVSGSGPAANRASPLGHRSGFLDEARWRDGRGTLQWTLSMEKFRHLKAYSPRVKVLMYGIAMVHVADTSNVGGLRHEHAAQAADDSVVSFGWFFLDLRTPDLPEKWFKLQNAPFGGEILISTRFAPFDHERASMLSPARTSGGLQSDSSLNHRPRQFTPSGKRASVANEKSAPVVAMEDGECLRLGSRHGADAFVISVSLQAAFNLVKVVETALGPREMAPDDYKAGFWLSYSLFDVVVRTDVFHNLDTSEFPPIRDSFRVMSCIEDLRDWCQQQQMLPIYLCTYNRVLGGVEIPFSAVLEGEMFALALKTNKPIAGAQAVADGNFPFPSTNGPFIDASVSIRCVHAARSPKPVPKTLSSSAVQPSEPTSAFDPAQTETGGDGSDLEEKPETDGQLSPATVGVSVYLDQVQLSNDAISQFVGEEGISLELSFGSAVILGAVRVCAYTKRYVLGDNDALKLTLANLTQQALKTSTLRVRCFSSQTKSLVGKSSTSAPFNGSVDSKDLASKHVEIPLHSDRHEPIGQCIVRLRVRHLLDPEEEEDSSPASSIVPLRGKPRSDVHMYRVFLQLKSLHDFSSAQQLSIAFQNPFTGKGKVEFQGARVDKKSEAQLADSFCMFELLHDEEQFKDSMQSAVAIDFVSESGSRQREVIGSCLFSLNFLYFSQDQFSCAEPSCGKTFRSQSDGEAHWEESHGDRRSSRAGDRVHAFKSCSVDIPVVSTKDARDAGLMPSSRQRVGMVGIVAYIEDMGVFNDENVTAAEKLFVPQSYHGDMRVYDSFSPPRQISAKKSSDGDGGTRRVLIAEVPAPPTASRPNNISDPVPSSSARDGATLEERERYRRRLDEEKACEISRLKESFEREKQMWIQDQKMQQMQWRRRLEGTEKARMHELEEEWARREEERSNLVRTAQAEYERLEKALRSSLLEIEARERRLAIAESALQQEQQTQREENERFRKRIQSEQSYALSLAQKQAESQERRLAILEAQLKEAEARARQVESDFVEYRQQQRKVPESRLREEIAALKGTILELEKQKMQQEKLREVAEANIAALKMQIEKMAKLVQSEKKKNETRVVDELEKLRIKYIAREEKYVLDGDREELRAIKKQLDELKGLNLRRSPDHVEQFGALSPKSHRGTTVLSPQNARSSVHHSDTNLRQHYPSSVRHMQRSSLSSGLPHRFHSGGHSARKWRSESLVRDHRQTFSRDSNPIHDDFHQRSMNDSSEYYGDDGEDDGEDDEEDDEDEFEDADDIENELHHHNTDLELDRLERERKLLLASGAYNEQSYLVRELTRLIDAIKANGMTQRKDPLL